MHHFQNFIANFSFEKLKWAYMPMNQVNSKFKSAKTAEEKKFLYLAIARAVLMGVALVATIWVIGKLNSGTLFTGNNSTAVLLGIPASR